MEQTYLHLLLNHFPIVLFLTATLIMLYGLLWRKVEFTKIALIIIILAAVISIPAFLSGEESEHAIEDFPGISHDMIEEHEEAGKLALWLAQVTGVLAIISFVQILLNKPKQKIYSFITLIFSIITFLLMVKTGLEGGKIRRPELRNENTEISDKDNRADFSK